MRRIQATKNQNHQRSPSLQIHNRTNLSKPLRRKATRAKTVTQTIKIVEVAETTTTTKKSAKTIKIAMTKRDHADLEVEEVVVLLSDTMTTLICLKSKKEKKSKRTSSISLTELLHHHNKGKEVQML